MRKISAGLKRQSGGVDHLILVSVTGNHIMDFMPDDFN